MYAAVNAILYVLCEGCTWRGLLDDFPVLVNGFRRWRIDGTWIKIHDRLMLWVRVSEGREASYSNAASEIIDAFNHRFFSSWDVTPQEQRIKFINIAHYVINNSYYQTQVVDNQDEQNRRMALKKLIQQAVSQERKRELDLYKRYASDPDFKQTFDAAIVPLLTLSSPEQLNQFSA